MDSKENWRHVRETRERPRRKTRSIAYDWAQKNGVRVHVYVCARHAKTYAGTRVLTVTGSRYVDTSTSFKSEHSKKSINKRVNRDLFINIRTESRHRPSVWSLIYLRILSFFFSAFFRPPNFLTGSDPLNDILMRINWIWSFNNIFRFYFFLEL